MPSTLSQEDLLAEVPCLYPDLFIAFSPMRPQSTCPLLLCVTRLDRIDAGTDPECLVSHRPPALYVPRYLSGVEAAEAITRQVLQVYRRHGVEPLVESSVTTDVELGHVQDLLSEESEEGAAGVSRPHQAMASITGPRAGPAQ